MRGPLQNCLVHRLLSGGVPGPGVVVERSYIPSQPYEIAKNSEKTGGFTHILAYKSPKTPFFAQQYLTRYTHKTFFEEYTNFQAHYLSHCRVIPLQSFGSHIRPQPHGLGLSMNDLLPGRWSCSSRHSLLPFTKYINRMYCLLNLNYTTLKSVHATKFTVRIKDHTRLIKGNTISRHCFSFRTFKIVCRITGSHGQGCAGSRDDKDSRIYGGCPLGFSWPEPLCKL
jgi:hypothetical protein